MMLVTGPCLRAGRSFVRRRTVEGARYLARSSGSSLHPHFADAATTKHSRRNSSRSTDTAAEGSDVTSGFGRRQAPVNRGNTALGKGYDLMEDDAGSRKKCVISGYDSWGFQMEDGVDVRGSMICLPNSYVLWTPKTSADITVESLRLLELVTPKIDLVIIGVGQNMTERLDPVLVEHLKSKGMRVEQMDTVNACSTFNVLNAEDRRVAAALVQLSGGDEFGSN